MKSLLNKFLTFLENVGKTRAAAALARSGKETQARELISQK